MTKNNQIKTFQKNNNIKTERQKQKTWKQKRKNEKKKKTAKNENNLGFKRGMLGTFFSKNKRKLTKTNLLGEQNRNKTLKL